MKKHILPITLIIISIIMWAIAYPNLPDKVPMHWNAAGEVDGYGTPLTALLTNVGMLIFMYLLLIAIPKLDPKKDNFPKFEKTYNLITFTLMVFFFGLNIITLLSSFDIDVPMNIVMMISIGILFIVLGNYLQTVQPNYFVGVRTPWTLDNEYVWRKTHRLSSRVFAIGGLIMILSVFLPSEWSIFIVFGTIFFITLVPILYSFFIFKNTPKENQ